MNRERRDYYARIYRRWMFRLIIALAIGGALWLAKTFMSG